MFKEAISQTAICTGLADQYYKKIMPHREYQCSNGALDTTLKCTCRALLFNRMTEEDILTVNHVFANIPSGDKSIREFCSDIDEIFCCDFSDRLCVVSLSSGSSDKLNSFFTKITNGAMIEEFKGYTFYDGYEDWELVPKIGQFFENKFKAGCIVNKKRRVSLIFIEKGPIEYYHALQCAIYPAVPWYFNPEEGMSEIEKEVIQSLTETDSRHYIEVMSKIVEMSDYRNGYIRTRLKDYEQASYVNRRNILEENINRYKRNIEEQTMKIMQETKGLNEANAELAFLVVQINSKSCSSELTDYLIANKNIYIDEIGSNNTITYIVNTYLSDWDDSPEIKGRAIHNRNSIMFENVPEYLHDKAEQLYTALFDERSIKLRMVAKFRFNPATGVYGVSGTNYGEHELTRLPNPHIQGYACMGGYTSEISECIKNGNYIMAFEISVVSAGNINFEDVTVMSNFTRDLFRENNANKKMFELEDGTLLSLSEVFEFLDKGEEEDNE